MSADTKPERIQLYGGPKDGTVMEAPALPRLILKWSDGRNEMKVLYERSERCDSEGRPYYEYRGEV